MKNYITLKNGDMIPTLGIGTWYLGEKRYKTDLEAIKTALDIGVTLIDTAEMYGDGRAEELIGDAIRGVDRERLYIVSKVYPHNAGKKNIKKSLLKSMERMGVKYIDMYLLHWRGSIPLSETVLCMEMLKKEGLIRNWGVSNFDTSDMKELLSVPYGDNCAVNQVLYHLGSRGIEYELMPFLKKHGIHVMAYCPMAQAGDLKTELIYNKKLMRIAEKYNITVAELLLKFVTLQEDMIVIPRSGNSEHIKKNWFIRDVKVSEKDIEEMNKEFPAPKRKTYLDIV